MENSVFCRKCRSWLRFDDNFGYCKKFNCQARHDDTCKTVFPNDFEEAR